MPKNINNIWPKEVTITNEVGKDRYRHDNGKPCCAVGWANYEFGGSYTLFRIFEKAYHVVAATMGLHDLKILNELWNVPNINDHFDTQQRTLAYNATMAVLGYTQGQPKDVLEIARKAKKSYPTEIKNILREINDYK